MSKSFTLKISIEDSKPLIWRRVCVPSDISLDLLHDVIQAAMGWGNYHLYQFIQNKTFYKLPHPDDADMTFGGHLTIDSRKTLLSDVFAKKGADLMYEYDFGDSWMHVIELEKNSPPVDPEMMIALLAGEMACPREDSGGIPGHYNLIKILNNPKHPEHKEMKEWSGNFSPDFFDHQAAGRALAKLNFENDTNTDFSENLFDDEFERTRYTAEWTQSSGAFFDSLTSMNLTLDFVHGFAALLACRPDAIVSAEWIDDIISAADGKIGRLKKNQRKTFAEYLDQMYRTSYSEIAADELTVISAKKPSKKNTESFLCWCSGFMAGFSFIAPVLSNKSLDDSYRCLSLLLLITDEAQFKSFIPSDLLKLISKMTIKQLHKEIISCVIEFSWLLKECEFKDFSLQEPQASQPELKLLMPAEPYTGEPPPFKNSLCPCGSGKKYKRCCGAD